jgi:hypothetical protein
MSRWLVLTVLAFVLSCYGFASFAQAVADGTPPGGQAQVHSEEAWSERDHGSKVPLQANAESAADGAELCSALHIMALPVLRLTAPPDDSGRLLPRPFLEGPKRPPRTRLAQS